MITSALMNSLYGLPHLYHLFICNEINLLKDSVSCKKYYSFVSMTGLTNEQVQQRIEEGKINANENPNTRSYKQIIRENVLTFFNFLNLALMIMVLLVGSYKNSMFVCQSCHRYFLHSYVFFKDVSFLLFFFPGAC